MGRRLKYFLKDGRSLRQYLKETPDAPPVGTVMYRIITAGLTPDEAIVNDYKKQEISYVKGMPFKTYCRLKGHDYGKVYASWKRLKSYNKFHRMEDLTLEQFFEDYENGVKYEVKRYVNPDKKLCVDNGINYNNLMTYWTIFKKDEYTFREYVEHAIKRRTVKTLEYMFASDYCNMMGYDVKKLRYKYYRVRDKLGYNNFKEFIADWEKENGKGCETT